MFTTEDKIQKHIVTPDGEDTFRIRCISGEAVGILTTPTEKSYFMLDSGEYWFDLIQEKYPPKKKCPCGNDLFRVSFSYTPRIGTDDYRSVGLVSCCTACGRQREFAQIQVRHSPSSQLFEQPLTYCAQPRIKYKTYSVQGFWTDDAFRNLIDFLSQQGLAIHFWHWTQDRTSRTVKQVTPEELKYLLFEEKVRYLAICFSLGGQFPRPGTDSKGACVDRNIWRRQNMIMLNAPLSVAGRGSFYSMEFCSEYIDADGMVKEKDLPFRQLVQSLLAYSKENL